MGQHYLEPRNEEKVACTSCMKDIPRSAAKSSEAAGYTVYFCGLECYSEWNRQAERSGLKQVHEHQTR
jgi:YHS domain-containing protein